MAVSKVRRFSPLLSVWLRPSRTIAAIAHENPGYRLFALPIIAGFATWPTVALFATEEESLDSGLILSTLLAFGPVAEVLQVFAGAYLVRLTGAWLGGKAGVASIQTAIAWGNVPIAALTVLGIPLLLFASLYNEASDVPLTWNQSPLVATIGWLLFCVQSVIVGWSLVIVFRGLAAVQGYSIGRAVLNAVLAWLVPALLVVLAVAVLGYGDILPELFLSGFDDLVMKSGA